MTSLMYLFSKYLRFGETDSLFQIYEILKSNKFIDSIPLKSSIEQDLRLITFKTV
jgi:hypothetical protein